MVLYGMNKGWKVNKEKGACVQCSLVKTPTIFIEPIPKHKIELLMNKYSSQEWLGYLVGRLSEEKNYFVEDLVIPPHKEAYGASAEAEPFHIPDKCIGVVHSHHSMGAFHSSTDEEYVDRNFPVSIVVARKDGALVYDAVSYQTTECGKETTSKGVVKYVAPIPTFDTKTFMREATKAIDKAKSTIPVVFKYANRPGAVTYPKGYYTGENGEPLTEWEIGRRLRIGSEGWD